MTKKHLVLDLYGAALAGDSRHAQAVMKDLGITYQKSVPQSLFDSWWFFNCENVPDDFPDWITELKAELDACIGHGLTAEDVEDIRAGHNRVVARANLEPPRSLITERFYKGQIVPRRLRMAMTSDKKGAHLITFGGSVEVNGRTVELLNADSCAFNIANGGRRMNNGTYKKVGFSFMNVHIKSSKATGFLIG